jgi:RHS repeat-associated protein
LLRCSTVTVTASRLSPTVNTLNLTEGASASNQTLATFTDSDGNTSLSAYSAVVNWGDNTSNTNATIATNPGGGFQINAGHSYAEEGTYTFTTTLTDTDGDSFVFNGTANVTDAAVSATPVSVSATTGTPFQGTLATFTDADPNGAIGDYTATINWGDSTTQTGGAIQANSPSGFKVTSGHTYATAGTYTAVVTVSDQGGSWSAVNVTVTVTAPATTLTASAITAVEGQSYSGNVAVFTPSPHLGASSYTAKIGWGDGAVTTGTLTANGNSYNVSGSHTYADEGTYTVSVGISDPSNNVTRATATATVNDAALTPANQTLTGWTNVATGQVKVAGFSDANTLAPASDFTATITWGDNTGNFAGQVVANGGGSFGVWAGHTYTAAGTYTITTTVRDIGGSTTTVTSTITVTAASMSFTATEGVSFSGVVASFTGNPANATSATITWGDGTANSAGTITSTGGNSFTVSGTHTYADEATYNASVTVQMSVGGPLTDSGPATVNDAALSATGATLTGKAGQATGSLTLATFTDANPSATTADFTALINWGDNTATVGQVQVNGSGFKVVGNHTYANWGSYPAAVTITDDGGSIATANSTVTVGYPEGSSLNVSLAVGVPSGSSGVAPDAFTATVNWGDGNITTGTVMPVFSYGALSGFTVSGNHVYADEGTYTVTATVQNPTGNTSSATTSISVYDVPLASTGQNFNAVTNTATGTITVAMLSDANTSAHASEFTATINWGDGTTPSSGTLVSNGGGSFSIQGSHTYTTAGTYTVTVSVTEPGGSSTTATGTATVVGPWSILSSNVLTGGSNDPLGSYLLPIGEAVVDLNNGGLRLSHALDFDQSPGTGVGGNPALVYNSNTVNVHPVVQVALQTSPTGSTPTSIQEQLTWNGTVQNWVTFSTTGYQAGAVYQLAVQVTSAVAASGMYNWSTDVRINFSGSHQDVIVSGTAAVVANDNSPYGPGWGISGVDRLIIGANGVLWVTGAGDSRYFASAGGNNYTSPAEDFGTLVKNGNGTYTYTAKDQTKTNFNANGYQTSIVDTHGLTRSYGYNGSNQLNQVTSPDGGSATLSYTNNLLSSISEPGSRSLTIGHDANNNLTTITDADGTGRTLGYDSLHHLTSDQWSPLSATFSYDPTYGLLTSVNRGLGTTYTISSVAAAGLGSLLAGPAYASVTDGLSHKTQYLLDPRGRLLRLIKADGATDTYQIDAHGQTTVHQDPLGRLTLYTYAYGTSDGDLQSVVYPDGTFDQFQYELTFHHMTQDTNSLGEKVNNTYDTNTGDLLTSSDALGNITTYVWSNGLLQSVTDPLGRISQYLYDSSRRQIDAIDPLGNWTQTLYDSAGSPASTIDPLGRVTQTVYSGDNLLLKTIDALGGITAYAYANDGQPTSTTNARGFTASTTYDQRGFAVAQTDNLGFTTNNTFDAAGNLTASTDPRGNTTQFGYDAENRQTSTTDPLGNTSSTAYNLASDVTSTTDARGYTTTNTYDVMDRLTSSTDPRGLSSYTFYDQVGNIILQIDPRGLATSTFYDLDNRVIAVTDPRGDTTLSGYDAVGNIVVTIDPRGQATYFYYDADNRQIATADPLRLISQTVYDAVGNVTITVDERGKQTDYYYDNLNRQTGVLDPDLNFSTTIYDSVSNVIETIDPLLNPTFTIYDGDNRPIAVTDADHFKSQSVYDPNGNVIVSIDENGAATTTIYDADNRPIVVIDPNGHITQTVYDQVGNVVATIDGDQDVTTTAFDGDNEPTVQMDANGGMTQDGYNQDGQVNVVTDPVGNVTKTFFDGAGNTVATIDPLGHTSYMTYDQNDRLISQTDRDGRKITYAYDNDDRLLTETWYASDGVTVVDTLNYTYDNDGNLLTASNHYGTYTYTYDNAGQVLTQLDPFGLTLTYGYDKDGNVTLVTDSLGGQVTSIYDPDNRLKTREFGGTGQTPLRLDITYTPRGQVATETRYKDLAGTQKVGYSVFTYDTAGNLTHLQHQNGTAGVLADYAYSYDAADTLSSETDNGTPISYGYDANHQLTSAGALNYTYDLNGNRTMSGYATGSDNRLTSDGTWNYTYDNENNVVSKTNISSGEVWTYSYDDRNHLTSAVDKTSGGTLIQQVTYQLDVFGNRVEADVTVNGATTVTKYAYDGNNVWADLNSNNQLQMRRLYDATDAVFARIDSAGNAAWYLPDHLGSVRDIESNATQAVIDHLDYDAYGKITNETQQANGDRYKYASYWFEVTTGLYHTPNREYNPLIGRWYSEDPSGFGAGDSNLGRYASNDPTNATDPLGLMGVFLDGCFYHKADKTIISQIQSKYSDLTGEKSFYFHTDVGNLETRLNEAFAEVKKQWEKSGKKEKIDIFGWSRGGALAYALANKLNKELPSAEIRLLAVIDPCLPIGKAESKTFRDLMNAQLGDNVKVVGILTRSGKLPAEGGKFKKEDMVHSKFFKTMAPYLGKDPKTKQLKTLQLDVPHVSTGFRNKFRQRMWQFAAEAGVPGFTNENYPFKRDMDSKAKNSKWTKIKLNELRKKLTANEDAVAEVIDFADTWVEEVLGDD